MSRELGVSWRLLELRAEHEALAARVQELEAVLREIADWNALKAKAAGGIGVREFARAVSQATEETT